jgi:Na+-driven multidrug efflux pump
MSMRRDFSKYSFALLINQMFWGIGFTLVTVIIGHLNADVIAANAIAAVVKDLASCFCWSLADGGAIMVGNELGAGDLESGKKYGQKIVNIAILSGIILGVITAALAYPISKLTNLDPVSADYLFYMLLMCVYYILGRSINSVIIGGIFASGGDTKFGMICDLVTMWVFIIPAGALAAFVFNAPPLVVYFILNLDEMIKIPVVFYHFKKYKWVKNLVGKDAPALETAEDGK